MERELVCVYLYLILRNYGEAAAFINCYFHERTTTHNTGVAIFLRRENDSQVILYLLAWPVC